MFKGNRSRKRYQIHLHSIFKKVSHLVDHLISARLMPIVPRSLRLEEGFMFDKVGFHVLMLERVLELADVFDIVHFHSDY